MGAITEANRGRSTFASGLRLLSNALFCGFRACLILAGYYPADLARGIRPFVDLLLTWTAGNRIPHVISDAGYWNAWDIWLRGQDLNL